MPMSMVPTIAATMVAIKYNSTVIKETAGP